jgi:hypothetical protein
MARSLKNRRSEVDLDAAPAAVAEYWEVDTRTAYSLADSPELSVGMLLTIWTKSRTCSTDRTTKSSFWHDLGHLTGLLRALAYLDAGTVSPDDSFGNPCGTSLRICN